MRHTKIREQIVQSHTDKRSMYSKEYTPRNVGGGHRVYICVGKYPDIDPNELHYLSDLQEESYETENVKKYEQRVFFEGEQNELLGSFGIKTNVIVPSFDFEKIRKDYGFAKTPRYLPYKSNYHFFDGEKSVELCDNEIRKYRIEQTEQRYVYRRRYIGQLDDDYFEWDTYFYKSFKNERRTIFGAHDTLVLSLEQIRELESKNKGLDLMQYYDEERPNIFVCKCYW